MASQLESDYVMYVLHLCTQTRFTLQFFCNIANIIIKCFKGCTCIYPI